MISLAPYLPHPIDIATVAITWLIAIVLFSAGRACLGRAKTMELCLIAGWGALGLVLTLWGVVLPVSLAIPAWGFVIVSLLVLMSPACRPSRAEQVTILRLGVISLPIWLILAPIRPSQPDTFLNLLPNAVYLVDHGVFPSDAGPPAYSFLPGAPYNTQLASYLGALVNPDFPAGGIPLFNLLLQLAAALLFARRAGPINSSKPLSWSSIALGVLAATLLNPGFVPRIFLTAYGEPGLAATALFAAVLMRRIASRLAEGHPAEDSRALGLVLTAMIGIKQSGIGLVLALAVAFLALTLLMTSQRWRAGFGYLAKSLVPPALLYGIWRLYVETHFAVGELKPLPFQAWQWGNIPRILLSILGTIAEKPVFFLPMILISAWGLWAGFKQRHEARLPAQTAFFLGVLFLAYNGFLLLTYIAHFPGEMSTDAHSYYRYNTHLSLVLVLAGLLLLKEVPFGKTLGTRGLKAAAAGAVLLAVMTPLAFAKRLRFDLDLPQPLVWDLAKHVAPYLNDNSRLAILLPGDNGSVAAMLEGVLRDTSPRRPFLDLSITNHLDGAALAAASEAGYKVALISCTDPAIDGDVAGLPALPHRNAALLRHEADGWHLVESWPYNEHAYGKRWQHILSWGPLCRPEQPAS